MSASPVDNGKARDVLNGTDSDATATATIVTGSSVTLSDEDESSSSASGSSDESEESTSEEDDVDDISHEYMASLLERARTNARAKQSEKESTEVAFANDEDVIAIPVEDKLYV
jgi:hypothetical protein